MGPLGQETFPSQEAEKDRKAVGESRGIQRNSFGSVFSEEYFYSCLNRLKDFYSVFQS